MINCEYLRAPMDPIGAMIVMGVDYRVYRELTDHGILGRVCGVEQNLLSMLQYHSFWGIVLCEARIHFDNFNQVDEGEVEQTIDEIAFDMEYLEPESWDDLLKNMPSGFQDSCLIKQASPNVVEVVCCVYKIVQDVLKRFTAYLRMLQQVEVAGVQLVGDA